MPKTSTTYVCQQCGYQSPSFLGKCPECGSWGSLVEQVASAPSGARRQIASKKLAASAEIVKISDVEKKDYDRLNTIIEEFDRVLGGGIVKGSVILVAGDPGIGKCVSGSTKVFDPSSGALFAITEWNKIKRPILALDIKDNKLHLQDVSAFHNQGAKPVIELKTRLGRILKCTLNHPLLTPEGWKPAKELSIGTRIAAPKALPFFGKVKMSEHQIKLVAYILSDGSAQSAITITSAIPEVAEDLKVVANQFGMSLRIYSKKGTLAKQFRLVIPIGERKLARIKLKTSLLKAHNIVGISWQAWARAAQVSYSNLDDWRRGRWVPSQNELQRLALGVNLPLHLFEVQARERAEMTSPAARFLNSVGLRSMTAKNKSIPESIFLLPKDQLALFLKVLFSCDGSVYITNNHTPALSYSTISHQLAQEVQHLLLRFGLIAKLRTKQQLFKGKSYKAYELQMLGEPVKLFLAEIGIWGRTVAKARINNSLLRKRASTHFDTIPIGLDFWENVQQAAGGYSFKWISEKAGIHIRNRRHSRPLTRSTVIALANTYPSSYLQKLSSEDIYWDEIESVTPAGEELVYDLTIPKYANFVANDLIIHNSTLLTELAINIPKVLYVSGEESAKQIKLRTDRINKKANFAILNEVDVDVITGVVEQFKPTMVIVDSIQTLSTTDLESVAGSLGQVRESAHRLQRLAKSLHIPIFLVGHVTKEGSIAGPKTLEHLVDVVLSLEGDSANTVRLLRATKNRFGATDEVGIFDMSDSGMKEIKNPSELFLKQKIDAPGSAVVVVLNGLRPLLIEVQALVTKTFSPIPKRVGLGIDNNRLQLLVAVISKRLNLALFDKDIFINVTGGMRIFEPAADLGICMAIISSLKDKVIKQKVVFVGEVGLLGEVRAVRGLDKRVKEARKLGFNKIINPENSKSLDEALKIALN